MRLPLFTAALLAAAATHTSAQQPPRTVWQSLGDSTLERLIGDALRSNHDVRVADARIRGARAVRLGAALELTPSVTATSGFTRQRLASSMSPGATASLPDQGLWDAGLRLSWDVDFFGRGRRMLMGQGALVGAASEDLREVQVLLAADVADAYFVMRGAQERLVVAERNARNQRGTLELTMERLEGGLGTALDSERAQALLSGTLADIPLLEATIASARYRLGVLTAQPAPDLGASATAIELPEAPTFEGVERLVHERPDVRSAERQLAARSAFVGAAKAEYLPRIAIGGAAGFTGASSQSLGNAGTPRYAIGPVLSWPALDLTRVKAGVDAAKAGESEARSRHAQAELRARAQVETALAVYRRSRERLRHLDEAAGASERAASLARLRFVEGASDFLPVLDAERTLLEAQDRRALGRIAATSAFVEVYRALGGTWQGSESPAR